MKKSDLTGSVTSIKSEDLMKTNPISINQGLQGRIAGVQVNQNDGAPGAGVSIQIRGANSFSTSTEPLYIVDGIPFTSSGMPGNRAKDGMMQTANPLSTINPSDIESIEILKRCLCHSHLWIAWCKWCGIDYYQTWCKRKR